MVEGLKEAAFRTTNEAVLAVHRGLRAEDDEWHRRVDEYLVRWGFEPGRTLLVRRGTLGFDPVLLGVAAGDEEPPKGWRKHKDTDGWVPHLTTKVGKAIKADLALIQPPRSILNRLPGMPATSMSPHFNRIFSPALWVHDGAMYAYWTHEPDKWDDAIWERIPMSTYYLAKEAHAAAEEESRGQG